MTEAQKRFCDEYLIDLNATRAYKVAYPNCKRDETAYVNSKVKEYIAIHQKKREERTQVTQDRVIQELAKIAFADIRELYNDNGNLKNVKCLEDHIAGAVSQLEIFEEYEGRGEDREYIGDTKKVKLLDKTKALELLGKHLGIFTDKLELDQTKPFEVNINIKKKDT